MTYGLRVPGHTQSLQGLDKRKMEVSEMGRVGLHNGSGFSMPLVVRDCEVVVSPMRRLSRKRCLALVR